MYPTHAHLIRYKGRYLGKNNYVMGFVKEHHAKQVAQNLRYMSPVLKVSQSTYVINRTPTSRQRHRYLVERKHLDIQTFEISIGSFFTSINNVELKLVDDVLLDKRSNVMVLKSEFQMDDMVPLEDLDIVEHLERLYEHKPGGEIDYANTMSNIIIDRYIVGMEDEDFFE
jgi:hypothetical protein